jgi:hypothetical protein
MTPPLTLKCLERERSCICMWGVLLLTMTFKHMSDNQLYSWQNKISNNYSFNFSQWHLSICRIINYIHDKTRFQTINYAFKLLTMTFKHMSDNQLYSWQNKKCHCEKFKCIINCLESCFVMNIVDYPTYA